MYRKICRQVPSRYFLVLLLTLSFGTSAHSQALSSASDEPEIGKPCPDFTIDTIDFYPKKKLSLKDLKGKWVVFDFWAKNCSSCIAGFPNVSREQKEFGDRVLFIALTYSDPEGEHRKMYAKFHDRLGLLMPGAISSKIFEQFNVGLLPSALVIDPNGIVRAIPSRVSSEKLRSLMAGGNPVFDTASRAREKKPKVEVSYDENVPFGVNGNGGPESQNFEFRSLLTKLSVSKEGLGYNKSIIPGRDEDSTYRKGRFEILGLGLKNLYLAAYSGWTWAQDSLEGNFWPVPILELKDTSAFVTDYASAKNVYAYSLVVPPSRADAQFMMHIMQTDLQRYFGYDAHVETRSMPYLALVAKQDAPSKLHLTNEGGEAQVTPYGYHQGGLYKNWAFQDFFKFIKNNGGITPTKPPYLIDETGIHGNISIDMDAVQGDFNGIVKILRKYGLDIIPAQKEMKVLVISDPK